MEKYYGEYSMHMTYNMFRDERWNKHTQRNWVCITIQNNLWIEGQEISNFDVTEHHFIPKCIIQ